MKKLLALLLVSALTLSYFGSCAQKTCPTYNSAHRAQMHRGGQYATSMKSCKPNEAAYDIKPRLKR